MSSCQEIAVNRMVINKTSPNEMIKQKSSNKHLRIQCLKSQIITLSIESCIRQKFINHKKTKQITHCIN